jgi:hypothetical protein
MTESDLTPEFRDKLHELEHERRAARRSKWVTVAALVFAVVALSMALGGFVYTTGRVAGSDARGIENAGEISALREDMKTVCRQADPAQLPTAEQDKCYRAEANLPPASTPVAAAPTTVTVMPSNDQLLTLIRGVIAANPPKDGHTPTADELLAIIRPLIPVAIPGPAGAAGTPGVAPTDAQLSALIQAIYDANPPAAGKDGTNGTNGTDGEQGPAGPTGEPGPTPESAVFAWGNARAGTDCQYVVTYSDTKKINSPVPDVFCL